MGKIIGYGKLGRSMPLTLAGCGTLGGDVEMLPPVLELARRHPDDTFLLLGRNSGEIPADIGLPGNVVNPWSEWGWSDELRARLKPIRTASGGLDVESQIKIRDIFADLTQPTFLKCDAHLFWLGQHGTTNTPIPSVRDFERLTKPQDWSAYYASFILQGLNAWQTSRTDFGEAVWLNADPRNYMKMRDLKFALQHPVLTQFNFTNAIKHEQYDGRRPSISTVDNVYARLEINGLAPGTPFGELVSFSDDWDRPNRFGLFINEARREVNPRRSRLTVFKEWIAPLEPDWVHGKWSEDSQAELDHSLLWRHGISPVAWERYFPMLHATRCTLTTPSSGSGWATTKPWEAFAAGTVCFFHPDYDTQNNILADAPATLQDWLRPDSYGDLKSRIDHLNTDAGRTDWAWLVSAQRAHYDAAMSELRYVKMIENRIYGKVAA